MIERGLRGVTTNPTIFEKAITSSLDYDEDIRRLARQGKGSHEIFESLALEDVRAAADALSPVYESSQGQDGFVSLELPPAIARDARASLREAARLHRLAARPNVMIKIPGTREGVSAVEDAIAEGIPVNVTLLFSRQRYAEVLEAYLKGLERRSALRKDLGRAASVASFFVSRWDAAVDSRLAELIEAGGQRGQEAASLLGRMAVANAKLAYQIYKREFGSPRFAALRRAGAGPQRLLWASTSAKNPRTLDTFYVAELIGPETVNTMPPHTLEAFADHGVCRPSLEEGLAEASRDLERLGGLGLDLAAIAQRLEEEGLEAFAKSHEALLGRIAGKRAMIEAEGGVVEGGLELLIKARFPSRLWAKDPSLWKKERTHQRLIRNSLGWLDLPETMAASLGPVRGLVSEVLREGFDRVVVLGMGGSSLACEVFRSCFPQAKGHPFLEVLDSTCPSALRALEARLDLKRALFVVSSKSGSTLEPNCFFEYFFGRVSRLSGDRAGRQFVAITDPGTSLEDLARGHGFRRIFTNPPDVGGRYSALSLFGLVPAALMGVDVELLLSRARQASRSLSPEAAVPETEALRLGSALASHARRGQDKLTLSLSPALEAFGLWVEQLVAESTGKEGRGIVPIHGEPLEAPQRYGKDRLFAHISLPDSPDREAAERLLELERAGHPVLSLRMRDPYDLGAQFFTWEAATAAAGFLLGINPFDQPDVQASKDKTKKILDSLRKGSLPNEDPPALRAGGLPAFCDGELLAALRPMASSERIPQLPLAAVLEEHLGRLKSGDYLAVLAFLEPTTDNRLSLDSLQDRLRELTTAAVAVQLGPRYLHSTGQLFKGGAGNGLFLLLTQAARDLPIPGRPYGFAGLYAAQAQGDFEALLASRRRILRLELGAPESGSLGALANALRELRHAPEPS